MENPRLFSTMRWRKYCHAMEFLLHRVVGNYPSNPHYHAKLAAILVRCWSHNIYIGGSNDKQKSYRGALIEREVLSNTTLSKVDHSERRPFFPFFQGQ